MNKICFFSFLLCCAKGSNVYFLYEDVDRNKISKITYRASTEEIEMIRTKTFTAWKKQTKKIYSHAKKKLHPEFKMLVEFPFLI